MDKKMKEILKTMHHTGIRTGLLECVEHIEKNYEEVVNSPPGSKYTPLEYPTNLSSFMSALENYKKDDKIVTLLSGILYREFWGGDVYYPYITVLNDGVVHLDLDETNKSIIEAIKKAIMEINEPETLRKVYIKALNLRYTDTLIYKGTFNYETRLRSGGTVEETISLPDNKFKGREKELMFYDGRIVSKMDLEIGNEIGLETLIQLKEIGLAEQLIADPESNLLEELGLGIKRKEILQTYFE